MKRIENIGSEANQKTTIALDDGSILTLNLRYLPAVQRWMMDVTHEDIILLGLNLCLHPNIIRPWRNTARFGIACVASDGVDPISVQDFLSERVSLYVLNAEEVRSVEMDIFGSAV
jgi:hypothetical protein